MMKRTILLAVILSLILTTFAQAGVLTYASDSCRTRSGSDGDYSMGDTNNANSTKLTIRTGGTDDRGEKSWIKFDVSGMDVGSLTECYLRLTFNADKGGTRYFNVSAVNDDYLTNIGWTEDDLTWNNAPGNDTVDFGAVDPATTSHVTQVDFVDGVEGDQLFIDVLSIIQADTDGIVQFILHNSNGDMSMSTHDHPNGAEYYPALTDAIPEPATMVLLGLGGLIAARRKR